MPRAAQQRGVVTRQTVRADGSVLETYTVRWVEPDGRKPRRTFDCLEDALDFSAKRRSAKRWRPEELRQEQGGRQTLGEFFAEWWSSHAMVELKRATLSTHRCLWEKHAAPRLAQIALRDIDASSSSAGAAAFVIA